jgi:tetratricopeptide (TPR) repeat protein
LQQWTQVAELDIQAGNVFDALQTLVEVAGPFSASAYPREFCRVAKLVFTRVKWTDDYSRVNGFDNLVEAYVEAMSYLGEQNEALALLDGYATNVPDKDVRYIRYCGMRCHVYWLAGKLTEAVEWGRRGQMLKDQSDVDTHYDIAHQLALAERDAGRPDVALPVFLSGRTVEEVVNPGEFDENRGGPHYGNIGRCLQFTGQIEPALICYQKSALAIEKAPLVEHVRNQGFIRTWLGEVFAARGDFRLAAVFFCAARLKWQEVSPPKAATVQTLETELAARLDGWRPNPSKAEETCLDWIHGREVHIHSEGGEATV